MTTETLTEPEITTETITDLIPVETPPTTPTESLSTRKYYSIGKWMSKAVDPAYRAYYGDYTTSNPRMAKTLEAYKIEADGGGWDEAVKPPLLDRSIAEQVGLRQIECPLCHMKPSDTQQGVIFIPCKGRKTGFVGEKQYICDCARIARFYTYWSGKQAMAPEAFHRFRLEDLTPHKALGISEARQQERINYLREHRDQNYLFIGDSNTGKTVYAMVLLRSVLSDWAMGCTAPGDHLTLPIFRITANNWLQENVVYATRVDNAPPRDPEADREPIREPEPSAGRIRALARLGHRPIVFIEELDKVSKMTEFKRAKLFELINAIYEVKGQLVGTANGSVTALEERLTPELVRRFKSEDGTGGAMQFKVGM